MDEKGTRLICPAGQEIVVPVGIKEMYVGIPKNRISLIVIECICANGIAISPVIIIPGTMIIRGWFYKKNDRPRSYYYLSNWLYQQRHLYGLARPFY
jgi:hypothetical protein